jgi:hypothetical protein
MKRKQGGKENKKKSEKKTRRKQKQKQRRLYMVTDNVQHYIFLDRCMGSQWQYNCLLKGLIMAD